jgi:hypothetical protein
MKIGKGDFITYVTLGAVAIIETINETLKLEPHMAANLPGFLTSSLWHFAPLALLCLVGLIWLAKQVGLMKPREPQSPNPIGANASGGPETFPVSIKRGLYVGDIMAGFDNLREDYVIAISIRAYNGTGGAISLSAITGAIWHGTSDMQVDAYELLPQTVLLPVPGQSTKNIPTFTEMFFVVEQRMPSKTATKLAGELDEGKMAVFDLQQFNIMLSLDSSPDEIARLPVFSITCKKQETIVQGRISYMSPITF